MSNLKFSLIRSMIRFTVPKLLTHPLLWRFVGFGSSIVGFSCYALTPSFHDLFGKFNLLKIIIYCVVSMLVSCLMLFVNKCSGFAKSFLVKAQVVFLILTLTSLYSFWEDRASEQENEEKGYGGILNLSSSGAFALMSLSLSRQIQLGFEMGMFNFFLGCFLTTLMKMNFKLAPVAAFFCYLLINIRSCSDYLLEMRGGGGQSAEIEHIDIESNSHNVVGQALREIEHADIDFPNWQDFHVPKGTHPIDKSLWPYLSGGESEEYVHDETSPTDEYRWLFSSPVGESGETEHEDLDYAF